MNIDLAGKTAVIAGFGGPLSTAIATALTQSGASIRTVAPGEEPSAVAEDPFLLVFVSRGTEGADGSDADFPDEDDRLSTLARHFRCQRAVAVYSAAGLVPINGLAKFSSGQAGLASLTRTLAMELGPQSCFNAVAVGAYESSGVVHMPRLLSHTAVKRPARIGEVVAAVLFLSDPDNSYMTGHTLAVDGGWSAGYARNF